LGNGNGLTDGSRSIGGSPAFPPDPAPAQARAEFYEFGPFRLEPHERRLLRGNEIVALTPKALDTLLLLVRNSGHLLEKDDLIRMLWPDTFVEEGSLSNHIFLLRKALGDDPEYIETVPRRGYRFVGSVHQLPDGLPPSTETSQEERSEIADTISKGRLSTQAESAIPSRARTLGLALAIVLVLSGALGWKTFRDRRLALANAPRIQSLAVLPLTNLSGDPEQEYFCDGLTETLTNDLGRLRTLRVISRTSAMHYKGSKKTVPEIARDLHVDAFIEGTVLRSANHVRITVNLVQASPEMHLWTQNYETEVGDVLDVQAKVAQAVAREIQVALEPPDESSRSHRPVNAAAQDLYFRGLFAIRSATAESAEHAISYFQQSIQEDPAYAPPYAAMAEVYAVWYPGKSGPRETMPKAREAARKALALDETLPAAHNALGNVELWYEWNWIDAEKEFKRALELDPNSVLAHNSYARELVILGRSDEALAQVKQAVSLDPYLEGGVGDYPIWVTYLAHHFDEAERLAKAKIELDPNFPWGHYDLALVYEQMGRSTESVQEYLKFETLAGADPKTIARLQETLDKSGARGFWRQRLQDYREAAKSRYVSAGMAAGVCSRVGNRDCAFEWLERAFRQRDDLMINLNADPVFDGIRMDPRFQDLVHRVGLPR
jgi:TolB-like protein/DNA-binding winged helix-turn-helix (wHTH) protein/Tfp pilus assembly protein PilF